MRSSKIFLTCEAAFEKALFVYPDVGCEPPVNEMVTKMVTNTGPRAAIERDETARPAAFPNTNQHLRGQNKTDRDDRQQISSAVLLIKPRTCKCLVGPG
jgi:hypothetical protein